MIYGRFCCLPAIFFLFVHFKYCVFVRLMFIVCSMEFTACCHRRRLPLSTKVFAKCLSCTRVSRAPTDVYAVYFHLALRNLRVRRTSINNKRFFKYFFSKIFDDETNLEHEQLYVPKYYSIYTPDVDAACLSRRVENPKAFAMDQFFFFGATRFAYKNIFEYNIFFHVASISIDPGTGTISMSKQFVVRQDKSTKKNCSTEYIKRRETLACLFEVHS